MKTESPAQEGRERLTALRTEPTFDPREGEAAAAERAVFDRLQTTLRREPLARLEPLPEAEDSMPTPLRPPPRLGPAEKP